MAWLKDKKKVLAVLLVLVALSAALFFTLRTKKLPAELVQVRKENFRVVVSEDGKTRARLKHIVAPMTNGLVDRITLKPGDLVKKGQQVVMFRWDRDTPLTSPIDGVVSKVFRESEGSVERGQPLLEIADQSSLEIVVDLLTSDAVKIQTGRPVEITNWGGTQTLQGRVRRIEPSAYTKTSALGVDEQRVDVIVDIVSPKQEWTSLGDSFQVECHVLVEEIQDALVVPSGSVFRMGEGWGVYRVQDGKTTKVPVEVRARANERTAIASGLLEGETLVAFPGDSIKEGTRVKALK